jgi:CubicO group peptidase (beta-lactamase class C family)
MADGGMCATLRDLARFGQLFLNGGRRGTTRIVPKPWIDDIVRGGPDSGAAYRASPDSDEEMDDWRSGGHYRNKWWVPEPSEPIFMGLGINGQQVMIHRPGRLVMAKLSTWRTALDATAVRLAYDAACAIADELNR